MNGQVTPGTLTFQPGPDHPFGYSRMDVVWSGFYIPNDPGKNYWLNFGVRINDGSSLNQCVDVGYTEGSKHPSLTTGTVSANSSSVQITATNLGSLNLTAPLTLFSIYYVGSPGTTVSFTWRTSPPNQVIDINNTSDIYQKRSGLSGIRRSNPTIPDLLLAWVFPNQFSPGISYPALGSAAVQAFPARTISGGIYKPPFTQSNCGGGLNAAVTGVTVMNYTNVDCSPAQQNTSAMNEGNGQYAFVVNEKFNYTARPVKSNNPSCGVNLSEDAPLFYIELKAKRSAPSLMGLLRMRPDVQDCSMATSDLERSLLNVQISGQASPAQGVIVYPNPAKEVVNIGFDVPSNGAEVLVQFYGSDGRLLLSQVSDFAAGRQIFTISTSDFPTGLVTYSLLVGSHRFSGRFVKQY